MKWNSFNLNEKTMNPHIYFHAALFILQIMQKFQFILYMLYVIDVVINIIPV